MAQVDLRKMSKSHFNGWHLHFKGDGWFFNTKTKEFKAWLATKNCVLGCRCQEASALGIMGIQAWLDFSGKFYDYELNYNWRQYCTKNQFYVKVNEERLKNSYFFTSNTTIEQDFIILTLIESQWREPLLRWRRMLSDMF